MAIFNSYVKLPEGINWFSGFRSRPQYLTFPRPPRPWTCSALHQAHAIPPWCRPGAPWFLWGIARWYPSHTWNIGTSPAAWTIYLIYLQYLSIYLPTYLSYLYIYICVDRYRLHIYTYWASCDARQSSLLVRCQLCGSPLSHWIWSQGKYHSHYGQGQSCAIYWWPHKHIFHYFPIPFTTWLYPCYFRRK